MVSDFYISKFPPCICRYMDALNTAETDQKVLKSVLGMIPSTNSGIKVLYLVLGNHTKYGFGRKSTIFSTLYTKISTQNASIVPN